MDSESWSVDEKTFKEFQKLDRNHLIRPLNLLIFSDHSYYIAFRGRIQVGWCDEGFSYIKPKHFERGVILDTFSKFELLIDQLVREVVSAAPVLDEKLDPVLEKIDVHQKIRLLREEWNIIDDTLYQLLIQIKNSRNYLTHVWDTDLVPYKNDSLKNNFEKFQKDVISAWKKLLDAYYREKSAQERAERVLEKMKQIVGNT